MMLFCGVFVLLVECVMCDAYKDFLRREDLMAKTKGKYTGTGLIQKVMYCHYFGPLLSAWCNNGAIHTTGCFSILPSACPSFVVCFLFCVCVCVCVCLCVCVCVCVCFNKGIIGNSVFI